MSGGRRTVVVAAVIIRGGRVLVSQRMPDAGQPGRWEFPGGKRERGESDQQALIRELREELGLHLRVGERMWAVTAGPLELRFYRVPWEAGQRPRAIWVAQFRWVRLEDLPGYHFPPADDELVRRLAAGEWSAPADGGAHPGPPGSAG